MADRSVSLIDGMWLENARGPHVPDAQWNLLDFANRLVPKHHWRFRTYYFDALPYKPRNNPTLGQEQRYSQKRTELNRINRLERFTVREGYCRQRRVRGYLPNAGFQATKTEIETVSQKQVDVLLAVELTRIAWSREALHIGLVAGDADYVAAVRAAKDAGAIVRLFHAGGRARTADALMDIADEHIDLAPIFAAMAAGQPAVP